MYQSQKFFELIFGNKCINFRCIAHGGNPNVPVNGFFNDNIICRLKQLNDQNLEIYFVVNGGGYRDNLITEINAVFIDLDCGRDEFKNYYSLTTVERFKESKLQELNKFPFKPTAINETRNGLQVFWSVEKDASIEQFKECEARLIQYFEADEKAKNPARPMRVPGFYWCKDIDNKFLARVLELNDVRYNIDEIINALPEHESKTKRLNNRSNIPFSIDVPKSPATDNIRLIKEQDISALRKILNTQPVTFTSYDEVYDYLKQQDLSEFLGIHTTAPTFNCVVHDDQNPSAGILISENKHNIYNCFACGFKGTIIQIIEALTGLNKVRTLRFLCEVFQITHAETEWQKEQKAILQENQRFIISDEFREFYPEIYKRIRHYISDLCTILTYAQNKVLTKNFSDNENNSLFYGSLRFLSELNGKHLAKKISILTYFGLIKKLRKDEIPKFLLKKAEQVAKQNNQRCITSHYSIPSYCETSLSFGREKAREWKEKGFSVRGFSREMLLLALGEEEANRVFPQQKGVTLPKLNVDVAKQIEHIMLEIISVKGWITVDEVLQEVNLRFRGQKQFNETQIKRVLPEIRDKYNLTHRRLTKALKKQFGINCKGYPYVIVYAETNI